MLYLFSGSDIRKASEKARGLLESLREKRPDAAVVLLDDETFNGAQFRELLSGQGLFVQKCLVYLNRVLENREAKDFILANVEAIARSSNIFIMREGVLDQKAEAMLASSAEKHFKHDLPKQAAPQAFNTFSLSDALLARDRRKLWALYIEAANRGVSDEEIHGVLFWAVKSALLAARAGNAAEAGLKPFVYTKSKRALAKFSEAELRELLSKLVTLYHEARRGKGDLSVALEELALTI